MPYHHGDLRRTLLDTALEAVAEQGPAALSLREVARRAGVSHAAPTHHFKDKCGLLTAIAAEGWDGLADALEPAAKDGDFREQGVAYVVYTTSHAAHFAVMRAPDLLRDDDPALNEARDRAGAALRAGASATPSPPDGRALPATGSGDDPAVGGASTALAGWALVHGLSALIVEGLVSPDGHTEELARAVTGALQY